MAAERAEAGVLNIEAPATRGWLAWNDLMPPRPDFVHVTGEVLVPNPGVEAELTYREPQGINPSILLLDLRLYQKSGIWCQELVCRPLRYDGVLYATPYRRAIVLYGGVPVAAVDVMDVHPSGSTRETAHSVGGPSRQLGPCWTGENPFPWANAAHPVCLSGRVNAIELDFCMDGARHRLSVSPDVQIRLKGESPAIEEQLDRAMGDGRMVTVCGRFSWGVEQGCLYLAVSLVASADAFLKQLRVAGSAHA